MINEGSAPNLLQKRAQLFLKNQLRINSVRTNKKDT